MHDTSIASDAWAIARSREEPEAFAILFHRHGPPILRYVTRRLGAGPAEDVVAETFLVAFSQRDRYDPTAASALPWLYGIATNLIRRHRRDEVRMYQAVARVGADPVTEPFTDRVDAAVSATSANRALAAALAALPAASRDVLLLVAWADLSCEEAALALGVPPSTVRSRLHRARLKLRKRLPKEYSHE